MEYVLGNPGEARELHAQVLSLHPENPGACESFFYDCLMLGDYDEAHRFFRRKLSILEPVLLRGRYDKLWGGEPLAGKRILLHADRGYGDTVQYARFLAALKAQGAYVVVECRRALHPLLRGVDGHDRLVEPYDTVEPFDCEYVLDYVWLHLPESKAPVVGSEFELMGAPGEREGIDQVHLM